MGQIIFKKPQMLEILEKKKKKKRVSSSEP